MKIWNFRGGEPTAFRQLSEKAARGEPGLFAVYEFLRPGTLASLCDLLEEHHDITILSEKNDDPGRAWKNPFFKGLVRLLHQFVCFNDAGFPSHWVWYTPKQNKKIENQE